MAAEIKLNSLKTVRSREDSSSKGKGPLILNKKKILETSSYKQIVDSKQKSVATDSKSQVKGKTTSSLSKTIIKTKTVKAKAEKKVYTLPGQKFDPPEEREPLRIFYESLSKQIPSSEMAEFWMMEHGLLSPERAKKAYERKQKRQQQLRMGTPIKSHRTEKPESSQRQQSSKNGEFKPKKRINYSDDDNDYIIKHKKVRGLDHWTKKWYFQSEDRGSLVSIGMLRCPATELSVVWQL